MKSVSLFIIILLSINLYAQTKEQRELIDVSEDPILMHWDELVKSQYDHMVDRAYAIPVPDSLTQSIYQFLTSDSVLANRIDSLNQNSPMELAYNSVVKSFIKHYLVKGAVNTAYILGRSQMYFPIFEEHLDRYNIPLEMKFLPIVESALVPTARSRMGATGLWQFMLPTGKAYGLNVNSYIDDRMDPYESTRAACEYLQFLYNMYGDWNLVLAAYNSGPGNVNKAIRRSGGKRDYWEIRAYLPRETRNYVPAFIAVNYVANYHEEHGLVPYEPQSTYYDNDTLHIYESVNLNLLASKIGVSQEKLKYLNPSYKRAFIPKSETGNSLVIPRESLGKFFENQENIYAQSEISTPAKVVETEISKESFTYRVKYGDVLGTIAEKHGVRVSELKAWNNLRSSRINVGQRLKIHAKKNQSKSYTQRKNKPKAAVVTSGSHKYYTIENGDTLWDIAVKEGISFEKLKRMNGDLNLKKLKPGQQIKIPG